MTTNQELLAALKLARRAIINANGALGLPDHNLNKHFDEIIAKAEAESSAPAGKTVTVRAYVRFGLDGAYDVCGGSGHDEGMLGDLAHAIITAEVPLPEMPVIEGRVEG